LAGFKFKYFVVIEGDADQCRMKMELIFLNFLKLVNLKIMLISAIVFANSDFDGFCRVFKL